jgi:pimeloyl-ACP methyl ester carboxylesterase
MPTTRYARSGDLNIAFQVVGDGPVDLVYVPGWISNIEVMWEDPPLASLLRGLSTFARVVLFDKRGTGLSDRLAPGHIPMLEERVDDVRAVMDAIGSEHAVLLGHSEGGNMCSLFAAGHPNRTEALILVSSYAKRTWSEDYPWAPSRESRMEEIAIVERHFGDPRHIPDWALGSRAREEAFPDWIARYFRMGSSPSAAAQLLRMNTEIDTRSILPTISVPTLCLYRVRDPQVLIEEGRWIASQIPDAKLVELPGSDHLLNGSDTAEIVAEIEEFLTGHRSDRVIERTLATVLFVDVVESTARASDLGDRSWSALLSRLRRQVNLEVDRHRGTLIDATGDEVLATFDGPARAIRAAKRIVDSARILGVDVRAGLHTGEIQVRPDGVAGIAVHIGARVAALAGAGEVFVSRTVKDLVAGSDLAFDDRGSHELRGVAEPWQVYAVVGS